MIQKIKEFLFGKREELRYPVPFGIIDYTPQAKLNNIKDDQNKVILVRTWNRHGNLVTKKYKYTEALVNILENNRRIPIYDATKEEQRFEVVNNRDTQEISYIK